ncbi:MAG TPA: amidase [Vicinamibacterales bacterium]|nr:amidase [Vicinamibacterales bacterium]
MSHPVDNRSIGALAPLVRTGRLSPVAIVEECLAAIAAHNDRLNAFIDVWRDDAIAEARAAAREIAAGRYRGPLHGMPISVKDIIDVAGRPTTAASRVRAGHRATADAPVIANLRQAGAILIGKTNLHEFAFGTTNEDSAYGPARHPDDPSRSPGGSSGGSAAAVAAGLSLASVGTDTGGSIRIPAAACGIVGLKPTLGELPTAGVVPLSRTLDHVGPLARTVLDACLMLEAMAGATPRPRWSAASHRLRLGIAGGYFLEKLEAGVRRVFVGTLERLRSACELIERSIPHASLTPAVYLHISLAEAAAYHAATLERMPEAYTAPVRLRLELGRAVLAEDYLRALRGREVLAREVDRALEGVDALVLPTLPIPAPPLGVETVDVEGGQEPVRAAMLRLTQLFNLTGHPAVSIPMGRTPAGLPCGLQLVGRRGATIALLEAALACEPLVAEAGAAARAGD